MNCKNSLKGLISFLGYIPLLIVWYFILMLIYLGFINIAVIKDAFGSLPLILLVIFGIISFCSVVFIRFFTRRKIYLYIIPYIVLVLFYSMLIMCIKIGERKFEKFTTEKWINYQQQRLVMYDDFIQHYDIQEYSKSDIEELLGKPDSVSDNCYVYYANKLGNIYVEFDKDKVSNVYSW